MSVDEEVRATRRAAGVFRLEGRALLEVRGSDRVRFLQGQLTNDVARLDTAGGNAGCHALVLTREGRIVAEFHVIARPDAFWLETDAAAVGAAIERLERFVIADDVAIVDRSAEFGRIAVEGPRALDVVETAAGAQIEVPEDGATLTEIGGVEVLVAGYGWTGEPARQVFVARDQAAKVETVLLAAAAKHGGVVASEAALEILRVEAGVPRFGAELGEHTLPAELRLEDRAISFTKGCYTGQEVVARMHSRGRVGHLLVGIAIDGEVVPRSGAALQANGARVGEVTSAVRSPNAGTVALGFVRRGSDEPGTALVVDGHVARVVSLPIVASSSP